MEKTQFKRKIYSYYRESGRDFSWRRTKDPYRILVSEIMLQQTQAGKRTEEKYKAFTKQFPDFETLGAAPLRSVLRQWQGLGYNRRAKALRELAKIVVADYGGKLPKTEAELVKLPGVGPYTAGAVCAFAFNKPAVFIETNIRAVFIHFFFNKVSRKISDAEILGLVEEMLPRTDSRKWYQALMDYGVMLKKKYPNSNYKSKHYIKQNKFEGSNRQLRGQIIKLLVEKRKLSLYQITSNLARKKKDVNDQLHSLLQEGFITKKQTLFFLP